MRSKKIPMAWTRTLALKQRTASEADSKVVVPKAENHVACSWFPIIKQAVQPARFRLKIAESTIVEQNQSAMHTIIAILNAWCSSHLLQGRAQWENNPPPKHWWSSGEQRSALSQVVIWRIIRSKPNKSLSNVFQVSSGQAARLESEAVRAHSSRWHPWKSPGHRCPTRTALLKSLCPESQQALPSTPLPLSAIHSALTNHSNRMPHLRP